jgi:hypothetical protein
MFYKLTLLLGDLSKWLNYRILACFAHSVDENVFVFGQATTNTVLHVGGIYSPNLSAFYVLPTVWWLTDTTRYRLVVYLPPRAAYGTMVSTEHTPKEGTTRFILNLKSSIDLDSISLVIGQSYGAFMVAMAQKQAHLQVPTYFLDPLGIHNDRDSIKNFIEHKCPYNAYHHGSYLRICLQYATICIISYHRPFSDLVQESADVYDVEDLSCTFIIGGLDECIPDATRFKKMSRVHFKPWYVHGLAICNLPKLLRDFYKST